MRLSRLLLLCSALFLLPTAHAALITFDDAVSGATSFGFDGDGDGIDDVIFSTADPSGFNTIGPGVNQQFINEPGLEGTTLLGEDLRVDFLNGAIGPLGFGFAMSTSGNVVGAVSFSVFDAANNLLSQVLANSAQGTSSFTEGLVSTNFAGIAAYATFDFNSGAAGRYIIDNFEGTFGSTEVPAPAGALLLVAFGLLLRRRAR